MADRPSGAFLERRSAVPRRATPIVLATVSLATAMALVTSDSAAALRPPITGPRLVTQPRPLIDASSFHIEPAGRVPLDGDGMIPNPQTPTGSPIAGPRRCSVSFSSSQGATSAGVNAWISAHENAIAVPTAVCLFGVFDEPLHIWSKTSKALLELAPGPGARATLDLDTVEGSDVDANEYWSDAGGVSIVDSRSVEVYGLTIESYRFDGTAETPAGIYVTARSDTADTVQSDSPHRSICFLHGDACADIYLIGDTVRDIDNGADRYPAPRSACGNPDVDAYGIAVTGAGTATSPAMQHVVVEDNTVYATRTGQSETISIDGAVSDFLVARNVVHDADNIGIDTTGWETGGAQASYGWVFGNTVYDVDTLSNAGYGQWDRHSGRCVPTAEGAAGIYDDGARYIWIDANTVWNADQGINLDVETPGKETDHLLVSGNVVHDDPGTAQGDPSYGPGPPGAAGRSSVAGHDAYAMYIDAFGAGSRIEDVYVHDNAFQNESQHYLDSSDGMPSLDLAGDWSGVEIWHNTIEGMGAADRDNPLLEIDDEPARGSADVIDCNDYVGLSDSGATVNGNFALPSASFLTLSAWREGNGHGWDTHSAVGRFSPACPLRSIP
jgi:hypothetical protein